MLLLEIVKMQRTIKIKQKRNMKRQKLLSKQEGEDAILATKEENLNIVATKDARKGAVAKDIQRNTAKDIQRNAAGLVVDRFINF